jgi:translocator protein
MPRMETPLNPARKGQWPALVGFLALNAAVSAAGGWVTAGSVGTWYPTLAKPSFNPPDWVFAPVWSTLFALMAVAAWRVWRRAGLVGAPGAFLYYFLQLGLNLLWSVTFFGLHAPAAALAVLLVLFFAICGTTLAFRHVDGWAALLFLPYLAWTGFAGILNGAIVALN